MTKRNLLITTMILMALGIAVAIKTLNSAAISAAERSTATNSQSHQHLCATDNNEYRAGIGHRSPRGVFLRNR